MCSAGDEDGTAIFQTTFIPGCFIDIDKYFEII
jgi:hypothetical protein